MGLILVAAYFIGSVPFALLLARRWGRRRSAACRQRQHRRSQRAARFRRQSGGAGGRARHRQGRRERGAGHAAERRVRGCRPRRVWLRSSDTSIQCGLRFKGGKGVADGVRRVFRPDADAVPPALLIFLATAWATRYSRSDRFSRRSLLPPCVCDRTYRCLARRRVCRLGCSFCSGIGETSCGCARGIRASAWSASLMATRVAVLGAGSWGTALAVHLSRVGHDVRLWARDQTLVDDMIDRRANVVYLPDVTLPDTVFVNSRSRACARGAAPGHLRCPVARLPRPCCVARRRTSSAGRPSSATRRGLEVGTHLRVSQVIAE